MSVDREQIRRDAAARMQAADGAGSFAGHCLALIAELEKAEKTAVRNARVMNEIRADLTAHRARLAKVPALVGAAKGALRYSRRVDLTAAVVQGGFPDLAEALAAWETNA